MSYLITCSGSKNCPESIASSLNNLSYPELNEYRIKIIELAERELDWNRTLPAWKLYSGNYSRLYPQVTEQNWTKPNTDVKILSALFGWIKHTDRIPYYDLQMKSKIGRNNKFVYRIWNEFDVLQNYVFKNDIDLLSNDYIKAINNSGQIIAVQPNVKFTDRGVQKGRWLNEELKLL
jgi:cytoplasmic iron level regulating protein YaaA (DUF328/UPF0246 family)